MHLINQVQDNAYPFAVDAQLFEQVEDQLRPGEIGFGERDFFSGPDGNQPLLFDPDIERFLIEPGQAEKFQSGDVHDSISRRGS